MKHAKFLSILALSACATLSFAQEGAKEPAKEQKNVNPT